MSFSISFKHTWSAWTMASSILAKMLPTSPFKSEAIWKACPRLEILSSFFSAGFKALRTVGVSSWNPKADRAPVAKKSSDVEAVGVMPASSFSLMPAGGFREHPRAVPALATWKRVSGFSAFNWVLIFWQSLSLLGMAVPKRAKPRTA